VRLRSASASDLGPLMPLPPAFSGVGPFQDGSQGRGGTRQTADPSVAEPSLSVARQLGGSDLDRIET
jgi:hypothetical protein